MGVTALYWALNEVLRMLKRQERVQSKQKDAHTWEHSQNVWNPQGSIKTPFSTVEEGMKFWGAIVEGKDPNTT